MVVVKVFVIELLVVIFKIYVDIGVFDYYGFFIFVDLDIVKDVIKVGIIVVEELVIGVLFVELFLMIVFIGKRDVIE